MLCLTHENLATKEDIENGLVGWAGLFKATTWEELKDLAGDSPVFKEVAESMAISNTSEAEKFLAQAHEDWLVVPEGVYIGAFNKGFNDGVKQTRDEYEAMLAKNKAAIAEKDNEIAALKAKLANNR